MNSNPTTTLHKKSLIRSSLPYLIIAAVLVNIGLAAIVADIINISASSIAHALHIPIPRLPIRSIEEARVLGNAIVLVALIVVVIKDSRREK